jgi:hypothetical protein
MEAAQRVGVRFLHYVELVNGGTRSGTTGLE